MARIDTRVEHLIKGREDGEDGGEAPYGEQPVNSTLCHDLLNGRSGLGGEGRAGLSENEIVRLRAECRVTTKL